MDQGEGEAIVLGLRQKLAGIFAVAMFLFIIGGTVVWEWGMAEMCGMFIAMGIGVGLISGLGANGMCAKFLDGCRGIIMGALVLGLARGLHQRGGGTLRPRHDGLSGLCRRPGGG